MIKKYIVAVVATLSLFTMISSNALTNGEENPCSQLSGHWSGSWFNGNGCTYKADFAISNYNQNVQMIVKLTDPDNPRCYYKKAEVTVSGTCNDGKLNVTANPGDYPMTGRAFGKIMTMEGRGRSVSATKQE